jgi:hypothetical protein
MKIPFAFFIVLFIFLVDFLTLRYYYLITGKKQPSVLRLILWSLIPALFFALVSFYVYMLAGNNVNPDYPLFFNSFAIFVLLYLPRLIYLVFGITGDIIALFGLKKTRRVILFAGLPFLLVMFSVIIHGMVSGRDEVAIEHVDIEVESLPAGFDNFTILQVSDWHLGSYGTDTTAVSEAIALINRQEADLIVFTGDIVNNFAIEALPFVAPFAHLKHAPSGNYAVLGNHDFSDYSSWSSEENKKQNSELICRFLRSAGYQVLRNHALPLIKGSDTLWLAGVDNWGLPPFRQYGNLKETMQKVKPGQQVILLTHNPSHWEEEVHRYPAIFLTLAGHTHGMQMGIITETFQWSPVQYLYPQWMGLYQKHNQFLYVNRGLGFIGFAARVGMPPEITLIKLKKK